MDEKRYTENNSKEMKFTGVVEGFPVKRRVQLSKSGAGRGCNAVVSRWPLLLIVVRYTFAVGSTCWLLDGGLAGAVEKRNAGQTFERRLYATWGLVWVVGPTSIRVLHCMFVLCSLSLLLHPFGDRTLLRPQIPLIRTLGLAHWF